MSRYANDQDAQYVIKSNQGTIVLARDLNDSHIGTGVYTPQYRDFTWSPIVSVRRTDGKIEVVTVDTISTTPYKPSEPPTAQVDLRIDDSLADPSQRKLSVNCNLMTHYPRKTQVFEPEHELIVSTDKVRIPQETIKGSLTVYIDQPLRPATPAN